uniref:Uncharacterized protein n=1 Tax=Anguilla anguilla TaxID=7936 RepID=A0A0E9XQ71_ANGAN
MWAPLTLHFVFLFWIWTLNRLYILFTNPGKPYKPCTCFHCIIVLCLM